MRYETGVLLGAGGVGEVYQAYDPQLRRPVALKFLRRSNPMEVERFMREARLQAQIEHPNICKVFEVGEEGGRPFIAMQFIDGPSIDRAAADLGIEQKIRLVAEVAEALHAAHRTGLVHRDIKPSNILVERTPDAQLRPCLIDFGLAREHDAPGLTETGMVLGTPPYMAPEQVRGEIRQIDRRTDVYGLGAVLYEILTGRPPFQGLSTVEVLMRVMQEEVTPPRKLAPRIPRDLETIVMKCLEKDPHRRYDSARAVADDLRRYLDGEPVLATRPSLVYTLAKKVRRHRVVSLATSAAALAVIISAIVTMQIRHDAESRAIAAQRFGQEAEQIDSILRQAHLLPAHDIRPEKALVRERMRTIESEMKDLGEGAVGAGEFALGRGYLALQEYEQARDHLQKAWDSGQQTPEVAQALARTLGSLYQKSLEGIVAVRGKARRAARRSEIERLFREPSLEYLRRSRGAPGTPPAYLEAQIAFFEKRYKDALKTTSQVTRTAPSLYEARRLQGDIEVALAGDAVDVGGYDEAEASYTRAGNEYRNAIETARSDPAVHVAECGRWMAMAALSGNRGKSPEQELERAISICNEALLLDAENLPALEKLAEAHERLAQHQALFERDPAVQAAEAMKIGEQILKTDPKNATAHVHIGEAWLARVRYEIFRGTDTLPFITTALQNFERANQIRPSSETYDAIGRALRFKIDHEMARGKDPSATVIQSVQSFEKQIEMDPGDSDVYINIGNNWQLLAQYQIENGLDPQKTASRAVTAFDEAIRRNPKLGYAYNGKGATRWEIGTYQARHGIDPRPVLMNAVEDYRTAVALDPDWSPCYINIAEVHADIGEYLLREGKDPTPEVEAGRRALREASEHGATHPEADVQAARLALNAARYQLARGVSPSAAVSEVLRISDKAVRVNPQHAVAWRTRAEAYRCLAESSLRRGARPDAEVQRGLKEISKALEANPQFADGKATQAALQTMLARKE